MTPEQDTLGAFVVWLLERMQEQIPGMRAGGDAVEEHAQRFGRYADGHRLIVEFRQHCEDANRKAAS